MTVVDLTTCPFFDDTHTERLGDSGEFYHTYEFSIPSNHESAELAVPKGHVLFPDLDGNIKLFVVKSVEEDSNINGMFKRCVAEDAAQEELLSLIIEPVTYENETPLALLQSILNGSRWDAGDVEYGIDDLANKEFADYETKWEAVCWIAKEFDLEIQTRVVVEGSQIVGRYIDLVENRGIYTGQVIEYSRDTTAVRRMGDGGEIYTAVYAVGGDVGGIPCNITAQTWLEASGDPCDKPYGQDWIGLDYARDGDENATPPVEGFGIKLDSGTIVHRRGVFRDSDITDDHILIHKAYDYLLKHSKPQYTYEVEIAALERMPKQRPTDVQREWEAIRIGDTVTVKDSACYPPYADEVRVVEIRRSYSDPTRDGITLGEPTKRFADYMRAFIKMQRSLNQ